MIIDAGNQIVDVAINEDMRIDIIVNDEPMLELDRQNAINMINTLSYYYNEITEQEKMIRDDI